MASSPVRVIRKIVEALADFLPSAPSVDGPPPDLDGRRPTEIDMAKWKVDHSGKLGRGGYR